MIKICIVVVVVVVVVVAVVIFVSVVVIIVGAINLTLKLSQNWVGNSFFSFFFSLVDIVVVVGLIQKN